MRFLICVAFSVTLRLKIAATELPIWAGAVSFYCCWHCDVLPAMWSDYLRTRDGKQIRYRISYGKSIDNNAATAFGRKGLGLCSPPNRSSLSEFSDTGIVGQAGGSFLYLIPMLYCFRRYASAEIDSLSNLTICLSLSYSHSLWVVFCSGLWCWRCLSWVGDVVCDEEILPWSSMDFIWKHGVCWRRVKSWRCFVKTFYPFKSRVSDIKSMSAASPWSFWQGRVA